MARLVDETKTLTTYPASLDSANSDYKGIYSTYVAENACTDANSSTRAAFYTNTGSGATTDVYYDFDCSEIPSNATINSVSCSVKCGTQGTNYYGTRTVQMTAGTTGKGSATTMSGSNSSPQTHNLSVGSWTAAEIRTAKLHFHVVRGSNNTTTDATFSVYGATLTVSYTVQGYMYEITASCSVSGLTVYPASQEIFQGGSGTVRIDGSSITGVTVTDNNSNVTSQLQQHQIEAGGSKETALGSYSLVSGGFNGSGASYFQGIVGHDVNASKTTSNYYSSGNGTIAVFTYDLDFDDIPSNATITRLYCEINGHAESASNSNEYMCVQLISGNTSVSSETNFKSIGTSNTTITLEATTIPTLAQLANLKLQCRLGYYGGAINGATCHVEYTVPSSGSEYYWTYTIGNISADHTVVISISSSIPPVITIGTPDKTRISDESGHDECICTFTADQTLVQWEARAVKNGVMPQRGVGVLVETGTNLAAGAQGRISVVDEELTSGDGVYLIAVYGRNAGGVWNE